MLNKPQKPSRFFTTSNSTAHNTEKRRGNALLWPAATFAIVGATFTLTYAVLTDGFGGSSSVRHDGPVPPQAVVTSRAFLDVSINDDPAGRIVLGLFGDVAPKTVQNFATLCVGDQYSGNGRVRLAYENSPFHRIIPGFMIQG